MNETSITRLAAHERLVGLTDSARLRALSDEDIANAVASDPDAAPLDIDWSQAELVIPPRKVAISIRLDEDILDFFKHAGAGYQSRINAVLRTYMRAKEGEPGS